MALICPSSRATLTCRNTSHVPEKAPIPQANIFPGAPEELAPRQQKSARQRSRQFRLNLRSMPSRDEEQLLRWRELMLFASRTAHSTEAPTGMRPSTLTIHIYTTLRVYVRFHHLPELLRVCASRRKCGVPIQRFCARCCVIRINRAL